MTVKQLIEELKKMPQNEEVVYDVSDTDDLGIIMQNPIGVRQMCLDNDTSPVLIYYQKEAEALPPWMNGYSKN